MEEDPKSASSARSEDTSRPSSSSKTGQKHEAPQSAGAASISATSDPQQQSKRRRGLGIVTPNACTECRKKRAKCNGERPCARCKSQKDIQCIYEVPVRQSKEHLRHEIDSLRQQKRQSDSVLEALARPELWSEVLNRIQNKESVQSISEWLANNAPAGPPGATGVLMPNSAQQPESRPASNLTPLTNFGGGVGSNAEAYAPVNVNPVANQLLGSIKQDYASNGPWGPQSQSQTVSTRSDSHPDIRQWISEPHSRVGMWVQDQSAAGASAFSGADQILAPLEDWTDAKLPPTSWTTVTNDVNLVRHLLALYFCWEYPTFASLSKEHFLKDFKSGRHRYCSPILVNALLALGCRFSEQPRTRTDPNNPHTSGDHFFQEALRLLSREMNHHNLTTIQALGIMSIREASCGRDSESWYYAGQSIRLTAEMGLHRMAEDGDADELAVQAATFWGAFALDHAWSLATGSLPQCSAFVQLPPKPAIIDDIEASLWIPYTDDGAPLSRSCEQPSNVRSVYTCFCELSELVHKSLYVLHSPVQPVTSRDLLYIYHEYLNWYDRIPEVLRLGHNFTPAVLFAHMYYHFAILLLFRPLIKLRIIGSSVLPRDVCTQAADAIQGLLRSYAQLYTLKRTPSFVPYFVLTSTIMHLATGSYEKGGPPTISPATESSSSTVKLQQEGSSRGKRRRGGHTAGAMSSSSGGSIANKPTSPPEPTSTTNSAGTTITFPRQTSSVTTNRARLPPRAAEALGQGIADLAEMAPCHHFAEQALSILRYLAKKWNVDVEIPRRKNHQRSSGGNDGVLDGNDDGMVNGLASELADGWTDENGNGHGDGEGNDSDDTDRVVRPATNSLNFFVPNMVETDFICNWGPSANNGGASDSGGSGRTVGAGNSQQQHPQMANSTDGVKGEEGEEGDDEEEDSHMGGMGDHQEQHEMHHHPPSHHQQQHASGGLPGSLQMPLRPQSQDEAMGRGAERAPFAQSADSTLENPLFWPFPMQGRPMLPEGPLLKDAGFEPL